MFIRNSSIASQSERPSRAWRDHHRRNHIRRHRRPTPPRAEQIGKELVREQSVAMLSQTHAPTPPGPDARRPPPRPTTRGSDRSCPAPTECHPPKPRTRAPTGELLSSLLGGRNDVDQRHEKGGQNEQSGLSLALSRHDHRDPSEVTSAVKTRIEINLSLVSIPKPNGPVDAQRIGPSSRNRISNHISSIQATGEHRV